MASTVPVPPRWNVFLSSTVHDLKDYRLGIKEVLTRTGVECYPSEDWVNSYDDTEAVCRQKFEASNSFLLLLGYWRGSELPGKGRTVTQEEFRWARERAWKTSPPPLAVLVPQPRSPADDALRAAALDLKNELQDKDAQARHDALVNAWRDEVLGSWKTATYFKHLADLREIVLVLLRQWDPAQLLAIAGKNDAAGGSDGERLSDVQLGLLCRDDQFRAITRARAELADEPANPALGLLVHGDRDAGEGVFLRRLIVEVLHGRSVCRGSVQAGCVDATVLTATVAQLLGLDLGAERTPQRLAELAAHGLKAKSLVFVLERCALYPGGIGAVEADFWTPFFTALAVLNAAQPFGHKLVGVFADFSARAAAWIDARPAPAEGARERLLATPAFGPFTRAGLREGLEQLDVPVVSHTRLVNLAMRDDAGHDDPAPVRAIERLRGATIEFEGDDA